MRQHLVLTIGLHDQRYHGASEWPPAPGRVFQALVAGAAHGGQLPPDFSATLAWLETLAPPIIIAPMKKKGARVELFVPNNDLDAVDGDPNNVSKVRIKKVTEPWLLEGDTTFKYVWPLDHTTENAHALGAVAAQLYQLGRGVDMAWASADIVDDEVLSRLLESIRGQVFRPSSGAGALQLSCPTLGTLESLIVRHSAMRKRLQVTGQGKSARTLFSQPPKPLFGPVTYDNPPARKVFDLRNSVRDTDFWPWPLHAVAQLVELVRNGAAKRLTQAIPELAEQVEQFLIGRQPDGAVSHKNRRVRIIPLPSIGHQHADYAIRRILVEVPSECPLREDDVFWAFAGFEKLNPETHEPGPFILTETAESDTMLAHYGAHQEAQVWRSVTGVALPASAQRRRIEPSRQREEAKGAQELRSEEGRAVAAVTTALRHAEVQAHALSVAVQHTPFHPHGAKAQDFANETRFSKHQLWHVEVILNRAVKGPLALGDGRFMGLGVMAPVHQTGGIFSFKVLSGLTKHAHPEEVTRALRRAVMARVQNVLGTRTKLGEYFSGHERDDSRPTAKRHIHFVFDPTTHNLHVIAPHETMRTALHPKEPPLAAPDETSPEEATRNTLHWKEREQLATLQRALANFAELRAGPSGLLVLEKLPAFARETDPLFGKSTTWQSITPYQVNRHAKKTTAIEALIDDLRTECGRRELPDPESISVQSATGVVDRGLSGIVRLKFRCAVQGPLLLGRSRHLGGGVFQAETESL